MFNIIDWAFIFLGAKVLITGYFINNYKNVPKVLLKLWGYGSFAYTGKNTGVLKLIEHLEIPKSWYSHFYIYAACLSVPSFLYMVYIYCSSVDVFDCLFSSLTVLMEDIEPVSVTSAVLAMFLFSAQVTRRLYETLHLQVFAKSSRMNIIHYVMAIGHYTLCVCTILGCAPLFTGCKNRFSIKWSDDYISLSLVMTTIFVLAWFEQLRSNIILAYARKDSNGKVVSEEYRIPTGGWFHYVSSAHRLAEVVIYGCLFGLLRTRTAFFMFLWVFVNQVQISIKVHNWYLKTFHNYPKDRTAIIPYLL